MVTKRDPPLFDLHAHTTASDGTLSPRELVRLAKDDGLRALAVTDHDTVAGVAEATAEAEVVGIELVPGVEVSANFGNAPIHVLGLFVDYRDRELVEFFGEASERRVERVHEIVGKLAKLDIDIDPESVFARSTHGTVGRPHVAAELVERGVVSTLTEAFTRLLGEDCPAYVGYEKVSLDDALALIANAGGLASLAHPYVLENDELIDEMAESGLPAVEVYHRDHSPEQITTYETIAARLGLLSTGGSDFHRYESESGESDEPQLGCRQLTEEAFEGLRAAARSKS